VTPSQPSHAGEGRAEVAGHRHASRTARDLSIATPRLQRLAERR
jgi:hypothetical protein